MEPTEFLGKFPRSPLALTKGDCGLASVRGNWWVLKAIVGMAGAERARRWWVSWQGGRGLVCCDHVSPAGWLFKTIRR